MTTLEDLKVYIDGLPSFPVDRTNQVWYGMYDLESPDPVGVIISNLVTKPVYDTGGVNHYNHSFDIDVFNTSQSAANQIANEVDSVLSMNEVTPNCIGCFLEVFTVVQEDLYRFHTVMQYSMVENP
jgi:hypothetical protein